jgi:hypothetical protein
MSFSMSVDIKELREEVGDSVIRHTLIGAEALKEAKQEK